MKIVCSKLIYSIRDAISAAEIEGRIRDGVVKRISEALPFVADQSNVFAKLHCVVAANPRKIIGDVVHRCFSVGCTHRRIKDGRENEAESNGVLA